MTFWDYDKTYISLTNKRYFSLCLLIKDCKMNGTKEIAQRIAHAEESFISDIIEQFGFNKSEAVKIYNVYLKEKIIKVDPIGGRVLLQHGAFWEKEVMQRALKL